MPRRPAARTPSERQRPTPALACRILDALEREHPEARCALDAGGPFQLAVATILSAQCTDERVNQVTPPLFSRYPDARALAAANLPDVEQIIRSTGFFRAKAKSIVGFAQGLLARHQGEIPRTIAELIRLPGIGRKTANVVLGHAFGVSEGIAVDTHVLRVANRLGLVTGDAPEEVERQLMRLIPSERWTRTTDLIIFHGRKVCDARRPSCGTCPLFTLCRWESRAAWASPKSQPRPAAGKPRARPARPPTRRSSARR
jgi:endonuclease-3